MQPEQFETLPAHETLSWAISTFGPRFAVTTSFQSEGMVLVHMAWRIDPNVRVVTIDTGRLPAETYQIIEQVRERFGIRVEILVPDATESARMTTLHGPNLFLRDPAYRKLCCHIRKVRPLESYLTALDAWAVGLRRGQSGERAEVPVAAQTPEGKWKLAPLAAWSAAQIEAYTAQHGLPRHPLYAQGYPSIGCAPCTRPITPGEDERAGRWWWELDASKECGLHATPSGQLKRTLDLLLDDILKR